MKKTRLFLPALLAALIPGLASAVLIEALDFTGGASDWTVTVIDAGYPYTTELDGDPTKVGYAQNTAQSGAANFLQEVSAPAGYIMSSITLDAKVSGYSSWIMLGRVGLGLNPTNMVPQLPFWGGVDALPSGVVYTDEPITVDASALGSATSVWVGVEIYKGLAGVYQRPDVSEVELHAVLVPTNSVQNPVDSSLVSVDDVVEITFTGEPAQLYQLQYAEDLVSPDWTDTGVYIRGTGSESVAYDPAGISTQKNYRIVLGALP